MESAQRTLREILDAIAEVERDIARFEASPRPLDDSGINAMQERLTSVRERLKAESWTSHEASEKIRALESRVARLEQNDRAPETMKTDFKSPH